MWESVSMTLSTLETCTNAQRGTALALWIVWNGSSRNEQPSTYPTLSTMNPSASSSTLSTRSAAPKMTVERDGGSFLDIPNLGYFRQTSISDDATQSSKESLNFEFETAGLSFFDDDVASEKTEEQAHCWKPLGCLRCCKRIQIGPPIGAHKSGQEHPKLT